MQKLTEQHVWWLTHAKADLTFLDARGVKYNLINYLKQRSDQKVIDEWVTIGGTQPTRQKVRLMAFRVSDETAQRRREQVDRDTQTRGKAHGAMCGWQETRSSQQRWSPSPPSGPKAD